jgi:hypothetical protein
MLIYLSFFDRSFSLYVYISLVVKLLLVNEIITACFWPATKDKVIYFHRKACRFWSDVDLGSKVDSYIDLWSYATFINSVSFVFGCAGWSLLGKVFLHYNINHFALFGIEVSYIDVLCFYTTIYITLMKLRTSSKLQFIYDFCYNFVYQAVVHNIISCSTSPFQLVENNGNVPLFFIVFSTFLPTFLSFRYSSAIMAKDFQCQSKKEDAFQLKLFIRFVCLLEKFTYSKLVWLFVLSVAFYVKNYV